MESNSGLTTEISILKECDEISKNNNLDTICRASVRNMIKIFQGIYHGKDTPDEDFKLFTCLFIGSQNPKLFGSAFIKQEIGTRYNSYFMKDFAIWVQQLLGFPRLTNNNLTQIQNNRTPVEALQFIKNYLTESAGYMNKTELVPVVENVINTLSGYKDECMFKIFELYEVARIFESNCLKKLRNSHMVEVGNKIIDTKWIETHFPPTKEKKFSSHYNPMHRNKILCSIDLKQANFTALQFINKELGLKNEDLFGNIKSTKQNLYWNDFISDLTDNDLFLNSKLLRESCVNKFSKDAVVDNIPKMNTILSKPIDTVKTKHQRKTRVKSSSVTYMALINRAQEKLMDVVSECISNIQSETKLIRNNTIIYRGCDEIVFSVSIDEKYLDSVTDELISILNKLMPKEYSWLNYYMHVNTYKLRCLSLADKSVFYVKEFHFSNNKENMYEYKMVDPKNREEACRTYTEFKNRKTS